MKNLNHLFNVTKKFHEHSDGIIAKQKKAYMIRKKEIFKGYTILMSRPKIWLQVNIKIQAAFWCT